MFTPERVDFFEDAMMSAFEDVIVDAIERRPRSAGGTPACAQRFHADGAHSAGGNPADVEDRLRRHGDLVDRQRCVVRRGVSLARLATEEHFLNR